MVLGLNLENSPWDGMKSEGKFSLLMKLENSPGVIMSRLAPFLTTMGLFSNLSTGGVGTKMRPQI